MSDQPAESSQPTEHSESVEITSQGDGNDATTHTEVTENGKKVVDETHPGDSAEVSTSS